MLFFFVMLGWLGWAPEPVKALIEPHSRIECVVIDAGHGGKDFGATSPRGLHEKMLTLELAERVREDLVDQGFRVVMTRNKDVFIPLSHRVKVANKKRADLFVSIHANASLEKSLSGFEVYYLSKIPVRGAADPVEGWGQKLKNLLWDLKTLENHGQSMRLAEGIGNFTARSVPVMAKRIRAANFYVLKHSECPAVLVETGYITNRLDEDRLKHWHYRRELAKAIVNGILNFKKEYEKNVL